MTDNNKDCANIVRCVGSVSELNIEIYKKENNNIVIKGENILKVKGDYIKFNLFY